ncbi:ATP-dependent DNA helicase Q-like SIM [Spinacia oleracea]|nr:ATP-dependent DNA helicase Q-like SIM [Spinacia oleracea]XP_021864913.2 ATP-dependent DNA helicase Q-like SIM [Spinacia oleracea]XP_056689823.1 ATP-dependent DNA helicase Q-like SIM [Spinacia oleracea]XP_056689824.1 ATP-dependent DNA helicase Q-like SIM [Spinacia oleracea]XP_056691405.1 ATP-dependent DNA helicase Q-like SIM [Spinacia oleracea]XP_056692914.1 ATP-dependent DNA helicase Q-like SIM [Spinacia oleracea]XP_056692915.1 ATP-dependent DNA helicase Q-like SIM [Spinacia oleracea]
MEALGAWFSQQDCLVLAATGSGKSLCFQLPALLTGKVVVVISPLISLMHDQCLKLSKHGISACFLGSGQPDNTVEKKAMNGMYSVVYVCLETLLSFHCLMRCIMHTNKSTSEACGEPWNSFICHR